MVQGELKDGRKMFVVRIEHFVKRSDFAKHLAEHYYKESEPFNKKLSKKEAEKILKRGLFFNGLDGEIEHSYFEASFEDGEIYNNIYSDACDWVTAKYEWLNNS